MIFGIASSRTDFDGHRTHEKQTVSSAPHLTAIGNDVTSPFGTSSPQHSTEACAEREAAEELGVRDTPLETKFDFYYEDERNLCFGRVFACVHEGPFTLQAEEPEDLVRWESGGIDDNKTLLISVRRDDRHAETAEPCSQSLVGTCRTMTSSSL